MRRRCREKKRDPRGFSSKGKEKTGMRKMKQRSALAGVLFVLGRKKEILGKKKQPVHDLPSLDSLATCVIFLTKTRREVPFELCTSRILSIPN